MLTVDTVTDSMVRLSDGTRFEPGLRRMQLLGTLPGASAPYLVLRAVECTDCDANEAIFVVSPRRGRWTGAHGGAYTLPGELHDNETDSLVSVSRLFFGTCRAERPPGVVQFVHERDASGGWHDAVNVAEIIGDSLRERTLGPGELGLEALSPQVLARACREVPGERTLSEP